MQNTSINTRFQAKEWLNQKLNQYGNTCWFPSADVKLLDKLIEKFGNTHSWNK